MSRRSKLEKAKGRCESGSFIRLPHKVLNSTNFLALSPHAKALLLDLAAQYKGHNNGDLTACWRLMQPRGWKSRQSLHKAVRDLLHYGLIQLTQQGGRHHPSLYALSWFAVDAFDSKPHIEATATASGKWKIPAEPLAPTKKCRHSRRVNRALIDTPRVSLEPIWTLIDTPGVSVTSIWP